MKIKKIVFAALTSAVILGNSITSLAVDWSYNMSSSTEVSSGQSDPTEQVIVDGEAAEVWLFNKNDDLIFTKASFPDSYYRQATLMIMYPNSDGTYSIQNSSDVYLGELDANSHFSIYQAALNDPYVNKAYQLEDCICYVFIEWGTPANDYQIGTNDAGGNYMKFVGNSNIADTSADQGTNVKNNGTWASDSKGWWIQNADGTYLTNTWYQSPASGLWYYMGTDGYMLTNTTTPDGYTVNDDGVWIQ